MSESNNNTPMRITQLPEAKSYTDGMYYAVASANGGTKRISSKIINPNINDFLSSNYENLIIADNCEVGHWYNGGQQTGAAKECFRSKNQFAFSGKYFVFNYFQSELVFIKWGANNMTTVPAKTCKEIDLTDVCRFYTGVSGEDFSDDDKIAAACEFIRVYKICENVNDGTVKLSGWSEYGHYIKTSDATVDISTIGNTNEDPYRYNIIDCSENDVFCINGEGAGWARLYCFIDAMGNSLEVSPTPLSGDNIVVIAPPFTDKLIINDRSQKDSYYLEAVSKGLKKAKFRNVIIDTDFAQDIDDAVALKVATWAQHNKLIKIDGIVADCYSSIVCPAIDGFMNYYGCPNIDIGYDMTKTTVQSSLYQQDCVNMGHPRHSTTEDYPDAISIYRKNLSKANEKVNIISVGFLTNLKNLLQSEADGYSNLNGLNLVKNKVNAVYVMGGRTKSSSSPENETNFITDIAATKYFLENCPVPVYIFTFDLGYTVKTGSNLKNIYASANDDLLYKIFTDFSSSAVQNGRESWDPLTMWFGIIGNANKCGYNLTRGTYSIDAEGNSNFTANDNGNHYILSKLYNNVNYYVNQINNKLF